MANAHGTPIRYEFATRGTQAKRAFDAMATMTRIDVAAIDAARAGD